MCSHDDLLLLVKLVTEAPPEGATRSTMGALAGRTADHGVPISASLYWRIWHGPAPCRALCQSVLAPQKYANITAND